MSKKELPEVETKAEEIAVPTVAAIKVLSRYRVEKTADGDAVVYERVTLNKNYADKKGIKKFTTNNGKVTYYAEKQVKKYSDNVVTA